MADREVLFVVEIAQKGLELSPKIIGGWYRRLGTAVKFSFEHRDVHGKL